MRPVRFFVKMDKSSGQDGSDIQQVKIDDIISANLTKDRFMIQSMKGQVAAVKVKCKLDASARTIDVCTTKWDEITDIVEIGTDEGIATTISPEEINDVQVLYNINQLTKIMSLMKTAMSNRKDDMIKEYMQVEKIPPIITKQLNGYILSGISTLDIARCINYYCETLLFLMDKNRVDELNDLLKKYIRLYNKELNIYFLTKSKYEDGR